MPVDHVFAIVTVGSERKVFDIAIKDGIDKRIRGMGWYHSDKLDPIVRSWKRRKEHTMETFEKSLRKVFPDASEQVLVHSDFQAEANRLNDFGEVYHFKLSDYGPQYSSAPRRNELGEKINRDGIPLRLINIITGEPYPSPPPGQQRYIVNVNSTTGVSYYDAHKMIMADSPRDAALKVIEFCDEGGDLKGFAADIFKITRDKVASVFVTDFDTQERTFFYGGNAEPDHKTAAHFEQLLAFVQGQ